MFIVRKFINITLVKWQDVASHLQCFFKVVCSLVAVITGHEKKLIGVLRGFL